MVLIDVPPTGISNGAKNDACAKITPLLSAIHKVTCAHVSQTYEYGAKAGAKTFENTRASDEPLGQRI